MLRPYKSLSPPRSERACHPERRRREGPAFPQMRRTCLREGPAFPQDAKDLPDRSTRRRIVDHLGRAARREGGNHKGKVLPIS